MKKYLEAGILSFICCVALGMILAMGNQPQSSNIEPSSAPTSFVQSAPQPLKPVVPKFQLSDTLPRLTPEETRYSDFSTVDFGDADSIGGVDTDLANWETDWNSTWNDLSYSISPEGKQYRVEIDPSNFGDRYTKDTAGNPAQNEILVVLHETTSSAESAIHTFQTHHTNEDYQVSYHALILRDGRIIHLVPPEKRAFGAGNSEFKSDQGVEAVKTNPKYPSSVNNFAYHISLETPPEAFDKNVEAHSGYEIEQYESLAWLIRELHVPANRVTTHRAVDRNLDRVDPRSFDMQYLGALLYWIAFLKGVSRHLNSVKKYVERRVK